jgi:quercetin 2,3-dioxygenase
LDVSLTKGGSLVHAIPRGHSAFTYIFEGEARFGDNLVTAPKLVVWDDGDSVEVRTDKTLARFLLVSGKPLNEPIARHGPFVMNAREEIEQTLRELRDGTFIRERS